MSEYIDFFIKLWYNSTRNTNGGVFVAIIPKFFFDAVVALGVEEDKEIKWIGTGFLVGRKEENLDSYTIYLITNYHIVENKSGILVRFNQKDGNECRDYRVVLKDSTKELFSKHQTADVIAIQIMPEFLKKNNSEFNWFALDKHALSLQQMQSTDVLEGSIVYSLGFPINMIGTNRKTPVCRIGCISKISDLFENRELEEYLIDLQAIPGNSGAPVINRPEDLFIKGTNHNASANLIGIISGTIDYSEQCDESTCPKEHEKSSGFAIVHPVDTIVEVIEKEYIRRRDLH